MGMVIEGDVTNSKLLCAVEVVAVVACVFTNVQQKIDGNGTGVTGSLYFRRVGLGSQFDKVLN